MQFINELEDNRLKHCKSVAIFMAKNSPKNLEAEMYTLGLLHDIGYIFGNKEKHPNNGGLLLKDMGYKYWKEVYNHGKIDIKYQSYALMLLNIADLMVDSNGNTVGFRKRLDDIANRYGYESTQYITAKKLSENLQLSAKKLNINII